MAARIVRTFGAVNIGSFRISAMVAGLTETGEMVVLGSGHRAAQGIKRGYVTDMQAATYAVRDAVERAEKLANTAVSSVWIGSSGAGLASQVAQIEIDIGGRRIEEDDIEASKAPLIEHLIELRSRLIRAIIAIVIAFFGGRPAMISAATAASWNAVTASTSAAWKAKCTSRFGPEASPALASAIQKSGLPSRP